ncbi:MAG: TRASH domain-containing protein [Candidatus Omnitrophica bacterium]|nr:TRASH domain-containing protein [Candidatus Omnitrophota bacterium]
MNKMLVTLALVFGIIGLVAARSFAEEVVKVGNKICPISGEAIGEGGMAGQQEIVEYKGKSYNLCCSMCKKDFLKDPEAAIKKMEEKEAEMK